MPLAMQRRDCTRSKSIGWNPVCRCCPSRCTNHHHRRDLRSTPCYFLDARVLLTQLLSPLLLLVIALVTVDTLDSCRYFSVCIEDCNINHLNGVGENKNRMHLHSMLQMQISAEYSAIDRIVACGQVLLLLLLVLLVLLLLLCLLYIIFI